MMYPFSCVLWAIFLVLSASVLRQIARYLPHHRSGNASKTHPKSSHDKFKTVSQITAFREGFSRFSKRTYKFREF